MNAFETPRKKGGFMAASRAAQARLGGLKPGFLESARKNPVLRTGDTRPKTDKDIWVR